MIFQDFVHGTTCGSTRTSASARSRAAREHLDAERNGKPLDAIADASHRSLAASLLPRLPQGYQQMLGRRFDEGDPDLSGGRVAKVALARRRTAHGATADPRRTDGGP